MDGPLMDSAMNNTTVSTHTYRTIDVPVAGGQLRAGVWDPASTGTRESSESPPTVLMIHGVTSSHLAWLHLVSKLPGVRIIAPDLRGRGASNTVSGEAGMRAHATDIVAVLDALEIESVPVVGHSMGGFVGVVLAHLAPNRVDSLVLVDGGLPLDTPPGLSPDDLVQAILGPTAARLSMQFASETAYLDFWKAHPAFQESWDANLDAYFAYDLVPIDRESAADHGPYRASASLEMTTDDTIDLNAGTAIADGLQALPQFRGPVVFVTVPFGLRNESPGLYPPAHLEQILRAFPQLQHIAIDDLNHYTIVMGERGAEQISKIIAGVL